MNDKSIFEVSIGKRVLKNEITNDGSGIPVYSANVFEPFGKINKTILEKFETASIIWGIDGDWMVNIIPANQPFYPTDHCGVIRVKGEYLSLHYIASELLAIGKEKRFSRTFRASTERIKDIRIQIPSEQLQIEFDKKVEGILSKINVIETDLSLVDNEKKQLLKKYLE